ncbi:MAG TPA: glycosyltransferase family 2 protein [Candidatus Hydrogenedentes bacterium]|nr:glycosyltransferase family 2 protein [Candidatus Hydrogenedentota bacterium]
MADSLDTESPRATMRSALAAVVPCYNAGGRVRPVLERLAAFLDHVIVVDDGGTDGLPARLEGLQLQVATFAQNRGKGHALLEGFRLARAIPGVEAVATLDSDGQHDPRELPSLYEMFLRERADLLIGSRTFDERHVPLRSRLGNKFTIAMTGLIIGRRLPDTQSGYRIHSIRLVDRILDDVTPGRYETEMEILVLAVKQGFATIAAPIQTIYEPGNTSSHFDALRDSARICKTLLRASMRFQRPST